MSRAAILFCCLLVATATAADAYCKKCKRKPFTLVQWCELVQSNEDGWTYCKDQVGPCGTAGSPCSGGGSSCTSPGEGGCEPFDQNGELIPGAPFPQTIPNDCVMVARRPSSIERLPTVAFWGIVPPSWESTATSGK